MHKSHRPLLNRLLRGLPKGTGVVATSQRRTVEAGWKDALSVAAEYQRRTGRPCIVEITATPRRFIWWEYR